MSDTLLISKLNETARIVGPDSFEYYSVIHEDNLKIMDLMDGRSAKSAQFEVRLVKTASPSAWPENYLPEITLLFPEDLSRKSSHQGVAR